MLGRKSKKIAQLEAEVGRLKGISPYVDEVEGHVNQALHSNDGANDVYEAAVAMALPDIIARERRKAVADYAGVLLGTKSSHELGRPAVQYTVAGDGVEAPFLTYAKSLNDSGSTNQANLDSETPEQRTERVVDIQDAGKGGTIPVSMFREGDRLNTWLFPQGYMDRQGFDPESGLKLREDFRVKREFGMMVLEPDAGVVQVTYDSFWDYSNIDEEIMLPKDCVVSIGAARVTSNELDTIVQPILASGIGFGVVFGGANRSSQDLELGSVSMSHAGDTHILL